MKKFNYNEFILAVLFVGILFVAYPNEVKAFSLFGYEFPSFKGIVTKTITNWKQKDVPNNENVKTDTPVKQFPEDDNDKQVVLPDNLSDKLSIPEDVEIEKDENGLTKIIVDQDTVNNLLKEYSNNISFAGYTLKELAVEFDGNKINLTAHVNDNTVLNAILKVSEDGKNLVVEEITNPSNDLSFIKMFVLRHTVKLVSLESIQKYLPEKAGKIEKMNIEDNQVTLYIRF